MPLQAEPFEKAGFCGRAGNERRNEFPTFGNVVYVGY